MQSFIWNTMKYNGFLKFNNWGGDSKQCDDYSVQRNLNFLLWNFHSTWMDQVVSYYRHHTWWIPSVSPHGFLRYWTSKITLQWCQYAWGSETHIHNCRYLRGRGSLSGLQQTLELKKHPVSQYKDLGSEVSIIVFCKDTHVWG